MIGREQQVLRQRLLQRPPGHGLSRGIDRWGMPDEEQAATRGALR